MCSGKIYYDLLELEEKAKKCRSLLELTALPPAKTWQN